MRLFKNFVFIVLLFFLMSCREKSITADADKINMDSLRAEMALDSSLYKWEEGKIVVNWKDLIDIKFVRKADSLLDSVDIPQFTDKVKAIHGREVIMEGFYIPVEETGDENIVILSAYPYSQCFFCGQAGVESIVDVLIKEALPPIKTDTKVRFSGTFKTNADDFDYLIYLLEEAKYLP
ncbi:MAG: hypothetical protein IPL63_18655 [Saprospiraceae bacterium]|nr:hypothetical protein [Saprospiraceae bacterium]MBK8372696.1 hypothetical protein [Saprospiraceae bacterium]MBK8549286.1 hypothetical protein [Saprospiraceae bacterium]MBK8855313.1 hypothetical protein [Saprospiraceae bacterium]MBK9043831.1 hypothetical protein [Saprospiraceae bacterium]